MQALVHYYYYKLRTLTRYNYDEMWMGGSRCVAYSGRFVGGDRTQGPPFANASSRIHQLYIQRPHRYVFIYSVQLARLQGALRTVFRFSVFCFISFHLLSIFLPLFPSLLLCGHSHRLVSKNLPFSTILCVCIEKFKYMCGNCQQICVQASINNFTFQLTGHYKRAK